MGVSIVHGEEAGPVVVAYLFGKVMDFYCQLGQEYD